MTIKTLSVWLKCSVVAVLAAGCNPPAMPSDAAVTDTLTPSDATTSDVAQNDVTTGNDSTPPGDGGACSAHTDCASCTADLACGWCGGSSSCTEATSSGPTTGTCASGWAYLASECPDYDSGPGPDVTPIDCGTYTDCASCTAASVCGWCATSSTCLNGTSTGSTAGACMAGGAPWAWLGSQCIGDAGSDATGG